LGLTRSIFLLAVPAGVGFLFWNYRRGLILAAAAILVLLLLALIPLRERVVSVVRPHGDTDSNSRRAIMLRTGWRMVQAHPWLGLGPEQVGKQFTNYLPADVPLPLPKGWYQHVHNLYLQYAAERGVPALCCFLWMIVEFITDFSRALKAHAQSEARFIYFGCLAVIVAILLEGLFEYNLGDSEVLTAFLAVIATGYFALLKSPMPDSFEAR